MGLNGLEFNRIVELLGRVPSHTELGMFAVMWSEHCGYKYSRPVLAAFKRYKEALEGSGLENAGIVDIGDGLGVTMKIESHNHPSAVEPYQGAATGVGGIIRDILTMGARPIACLDSLRFGPIVDGEAEPAVVDRNRYLFEHVVAGIGGYGNCVGVPTVAGEVAFHPRYSGNPLVNAMCVGILRLDEIATAAAAGPGNPVVYLGSATGRDGIHGATFASDTLGEDNDAKRPNVQIGDPFAEKLLIEATLDALQTGAVVAIQDMGAAGLTCSTVEMSSKGGVGMAIDLDLVPAREADLSGYELMLSESQERMLAVAKAGREAELIAAFERWGLKAVVIGRVTDDGLVAVRRHGEIVANVAAKALTDHCPTYTNEKRPSAAFERAARFDPGSLPALDPNYALLRLLGHPDLASKRWVFRQFDQQVQTQTALVSGAGDAAVLAPRGTRKGLAVKIDGNARQTYLHPRRGGKLAVAEAARNVACTGAKPVAITDGLNFGNPQLPHVYWQFDEAVRGIAEAAEVLGTPVISGNVSFYNQSDLGEVLPTPLIGMLGVMDDVECRLPLSPPPGNGLLALVSVPFVLSDQRGLGASAYAALACGVEDGYPEEPNLEGERALAEFLVGAASERRLISAHDSSEGGLAVALAEIAVVGGHAIEANLQGEAIPALFGERPGQVVLSVANEAAITWLASQARSRGLELGKIGTYREGTGLAIQVEDKTAIRLEGDALQSAYDYAIPNLMGH